MRLRGARPRADRRLASLRRARRPPAPRGRPHRRRALVSAAAGRGAGASATSSATRRCRRGAPGSTARGSRLAPCSACPAAPPLSGWPTDPINSTTAQAAMARNGCGATCARRPRARCCASPPCGRRRRAGRPRPGPRARSRARARGRRRRRRPPTGAPVPRDRGDASARCGARGSARCGRGASSVLGQARRPARARVGRDLGAVLAAAGAEASRPRSQRQRRRPLGIAPGNGTRPRAGPSGSACRRSSRGSSATRPPPPGCPRALWRDALSGLRCGGFGSAVRSGRGCRLRPRRAPRRSAARRVAARSPCRGRARPPARRGGRRARTSSRQRARPGVFMGTSPRARGARRGGDDAETALAAVSARRAAQRRGCRRRPRAPRSRRRAGCAGGRARRPGLARGAAQLGLRARPGVFGRRPERRVRARLRQGRWRVGHACPRQCAALRAATTAQHSAPGGGRAWRARRAGRDRVDAARLSAVGSRGSRAASA